MQNHKPQSYIFMKNHIENLKIKNIFFRKNIDWDLKQVNVLVGKNGLGKTTVLNLINSALTHNPCKYLDICDEVIVNLCNKKIYHALKEDLTEDILNKMIQEISTSEEVVDSLMKSIIKDQKLLIKNKKTEKKIRDEIKEKIISEIKLELTPSEGKKKSGYKFGVNVKPIETVFISTSNRIIVTLCKNIHNCFSGKPPYVYIIVVFTYCAAFYFIII